MPTPFFLRVQKTIDTTERLAREIKIRQASTKAAEDAAIAPVKKKSVFSQAIKMAADFTPNVIEDVAATAGKSTWKGLETWGNQVQSVPAALFTKGTVEDGQYTTKRNLIGNPLSNVKSHVKAQREVGIAPEGGNLLEDIGAGFKSARLAGKAYEEDPDIAAGVKFGTGVIFDPTSYLAAGTLSKLPKVAKVGGAKGKLARGALGVVEGFENPAQVGKFAVGGALGTELASSYDIPYVPEAVEQIGGGLGGGIVGVTKAPRRAAELGEKYIPGAKQGFGSTTEVVETGERVYHGTPNYIPKGEIIISPKGDMTAGFYLSRDADIASKVAEEAGDNINATGFPQEFLEERAARVSSEGGNQVYRYKPAKDLLLLRWSERLTADEVSRINNSLAKLGKERVVTTNMDAREAVATIRPSIDGFGGQTPNILGVFSDAGFDGFSQDHGGYPQIVLFQPNKVLEETLTPPTVVKGSAAKKSTTSSPIGQPKKQVEIKKNANGKWELTHPDGLISEGFFFDELYSWAKNYGYEPVYKGPMSELDSDSTVNSILSKLKNFDEQGNLKPEPKLLHKTEPLPKYSNPYDNPFTPAKKALWEGYVDYETTAAEKAQIKNKIDNMTEAQAKQEVDSLGLVVGEETFDDLGPLGKALKEALEKDSSIQKSKLLPVLVKELEDKGHVIHGLGVNDPNPIPINFTEFAHYLTPVNLQHYKEALEWADYEGLLDSIGTEQLIQIEKYSKNSSIAKPNIAEAIQPKKAYANELYAKDIEHLGYIKDIGQKPVDMSTVNSELYLKSTHEALTWGADKGKLSLEGAKQLEYLDDKFGKWGTQISQPKGVAPAIQPNKIPHQSELNPNYVNHILEQGYIGEGNKPGLIPMDFTDPGLDSYIYKNAQDALYWANTNGLLTEDGIKQLDDLADILDDTPKTPKVAPALKPVDPDEIAGITKPSGPQTVDEFVDFTEKHLGKPNEYKDYATPGQEGSPIAGKPKGKGTITPKKVDGKWTAGGHSNKDLGDLIDTLIKAGYKVNDPFEHVGGGANPETLVSPITPQIGLTKGEKISNVFTKVKKYITTHGIENNAIATPIAKEYLRINNVLKTQATNLHKLAQQVEKLTGATRVEDIANTLNPSEETKKVIAAFQRAESAFVQAQRDMEVKRTLHAAEFFEHLKKEESFHNLGLADMYLEYGNSVASRVADRWLEKQILRLDEAVKLSDSAGKPIPTSTVWGLQSHKKLPKEVGAVLSDAVSKVHTHKGSDWSELYNAVNNQLRGMWAAGDASFIGIQQLITWPDNPAAAAKSVKVGFQTLKDPTVVADFIRTHDELRYGTGKPTVTEYIAHNMHIAQATGEGTDLGGIGGRVQSIRGYGAFLKKSNTLFTETGNINRIAIADYLWDQYEAGGISMLLGVPIKGGAKIGAKEGMTRGQILDAIGDAANRATGYSQRGFGGTYGSALFFAPRFMQSQLEMILKAAYGNQLENQVARRQLVKLVSIGAALTGTINWLNDESTELDPRSSNFMRIKNVLGTDVSLFGPWDTLVRGVVRAVPTIDEEGNVTFGDPTYIVRSKLSPVLSTSLDWITGENILGEPANKWQNVLKNTFLPFSLREIGEESPLASGIGLLGGKATPLTETEKLDNKLKRAGISKSDPDYLIKKREYLAEHPEDVPKARSGDFKRSQEVQKDIKDRRKANDDLALQSGQTLKEFRNNRKILLTEQRNRLDEIIKFDSNTLNSKQRKWLNSYFEILDDEENKNFITGEINPDKFDSAVASWVNTTGNGIEAQNFVNRYMGAGLNTVESAYYKDMRTLESAGYFKLPKYRNMKSDLTEDEILSLVEIVDGFRVANPGLQDQSWAKTARKVLKDSIDNKELLDVIHSRLDAYQNPEIEKLKRKYAKEVLWFNPRANWDSYTNYNPDNTFKGKLGTPKLGGALKNSLKSTIE